MSAVKRGRGLKEIHIKIFLSALPCTWQIPGRTWPLESDLLKASLGKSSVKSLLNHAKGLEEMWPHTVEENEMDVSRRCGMSRAWQTV